MDSKKLEILMTAIDLGSFSKASEVVGYTQSGLTHMVDSLERDIGLTLVRRDHNGITLTKEGETLIPSIREFLRANAKLENQIAAITDKKRDTHPCRGLRQHRHALDAGDFVPLPPRLPEYRRRFAHGRRMKSEPFELLENGRTDVIFAARAGGLFLRLDAALSGRNVCDPAAGLSAGWAANVSRSKRLRGKEFLMPYGKFDLDVKAAIGYKQCKTKDQALSCRRRDGHPYGR
ncbi:MAG: LysR family transcriptional regulator [Oscillospiraceae bacterium]